MTLNKPNRDEFRAAYREVTGVELLDNTIDVFFRLLANIRASKFNTYLAVIEWNDGTVNLRRRIYS